MPVVDRRLVISFFIVIPFLLSIYYKSSSEKPQLSGIDNTSISGLRKLAGYLFVMCYVRVYRICSIHQGSYPKQSLMLVSFRYVLAFLQPCRVSSCLMLILNLYSLNSVFTHNNKLTRTKPLNHANRLMQHHGLPGRYRFAATIIAHHVAYRS